MLRFSFSFWLIYWYFSWQSLSANIYHYYSVVTGGLFYLRTPQKYYQINTRHSHSFLYYESYESFYLIIISSLVLVYPIVSQNKNLFHQLYFLACLPVFYYTSALTCEESLETWLAGWLVQVVMGKLTFFLASCRKPSIHYASVFFLASSHIELFSLMADFFPLPPPHAPLYFSSLFFLFLFFFFFFSSTSLLSLLLSLLL